MNNFRARTLAFFADWMRSPAPSDAAAIQRYKQATDRIFGRNADGTARYLTSTAKWEPDENQAVQAWVNEVVQLGLAERPTWL